MRTIKEIKEYCVQVDLQNVLAGDKSIQAYDGDNHIPLTTEKEIRLFYMNANIKDLLQIYAEYNGLKCYKKDEPEDYAISYGLDIIDLIQNI